MKSSTVLFCANPETSNEEIERIANELSQTGQFLAVHVQAVLPTMPLNAYGGLPYSGLPGAEFWSRELGAAQGSLHGKAEQVDAILSKTNCSGEVRPVICAESDVENAVKLSAKYSDIAIFASNLCDTPDLMKDLAHGVLFGSPVGLLLNGGADIAMDRILIAWDDSPTAARAVHLALPMLKAAQSVTVACFDPVGMADGEAFEPGAALSKWLGHHGCKVEIAQFPSGGKEVAVCMLERAKELGADLVVAGAYGHSRMRQAVFGGTTRSLLEQTGQAVFLAH